MNSAFPLARVACLLVSLAVAGCAAQTSGRYPSLLPRAIESRSDAEPEVVIALAESDSIVDAALPELRATIATAIADFAKAAQIADRLASTAQGDSIGGDRWIAAQTAVAELDGYRATLSSAVTDLDALALNRAAEGKPDYPALTALHATAQAALDEQAARITAISARLPAA
ncbi:hypothetical protein [Sphingomonas sp.]|uniref:hypothetical protein n=1 Tax=Sphingomonas sp. TaxID=28214 RepID=UPI0033402737